MTFHSKMSLFVIYGNSIFFFFCQHKVLLTHCPNAHTPAAMFKHNTPSYKCKTSVSRMWHIWIWCCATTHMWCRTERSFRTVVRWLPWIGWLAGGCDDSGLAESHRLGAEVGQVWICSRALTEWERMVRQREPSIYSSHIQDSSSFSPVEYLLLVPCSTCQT